MVEMRQIVRIITSDIPGGKQLQHALTSVSGISFPYANAICNALNIQKTKKVGLCSPEEIKKIEEAIKNPEKHGIPSYLVNRRKDYESGKDKHIVTAELKLTKEFDVKRFKRIKSYRGIRHALGLPLRGQRTQSNFRKGKAVGVSKKKAKKGKKG